MAALITPAPEPAPKPARAHDPPHFDGLARPYRWLEYLTFGAALHRTRTHFLPALVPFRHALVLGDGDGRFTAALLRTYPAVHADAVDLSPAMLRLLARRAERAHPTASGRLQTFTADARALPAAGVLTGPSRYDLVVTHFFLDCLTQPELDALVAEIRPHLTPGAAWLVSDFTIPPSGLLRPVARALVRTLYVAFRLLTGLRVSTLPDHAAALRQAGFRRSAHQTALGGILLTELWCLDPSPATMPRPSQSDPHPAKPVSDPLPDPEPPLPSLPQPDPGVFHHDPEPPPPPVPSPS